MDEFKWIQMSSFVLLMLQFTAAVIGEHQTFSVARVGEEVTLPCENVLKDHHKCDSTTWLTSPHEGVTTKTLVSLGQIRKNEISKDKSDRLSVTAGCSLVITNVTVEDVGRYICRQFNKTGKQQGPDAQVYLSVINLEEHQTNDLVRLVCSVLTYADCGYSVKWLHEDDDKSNLTLTPHTCGASVEFKTAHHKHKSNVHDSLKCSVTNKTRGQTFLYKVDPEFSSGNRPTGGQKTPSAGDSTAARTDCSVLDYMMLVLRVAELLLITLIAVLLIRAAGKQRPPDDNTVSRSVRRRTARRSGAAAGQVKVSSDRRWWCVQVNNDEDEDEGVVKYENFGETSASVSLH